MYLVILWWIDFLLGFGDCEQIIPIFRVRKLFVFSDKDVHCVPSPVTVSPSRCQLEYEMLFLHFSLNTSSGITECIVGGGMNVIHISMLCNHSSNLI